MCVSVIECDCPAWFVTRRATYCDEPTKGPQVVRPWNLAWRSDFGLSHFVEPEEMLQLAELYLLEGFHGFIIWILGGWS